MFLERYREYLDRHGVKSEREIDYTLDNIQEIIDIYALDEDNRYEFLKELAYIQYEKGNKEVMVAMYMYNFMHFYDPQTNYPTMKAFEKLGVSKDTPITEKEARLLLDNLFCKGWLDEF